MQCPRCQHENPADARFCGECAGSLAEDIACGACGRTNPPHQKFCHGCAAPLAAGSSASPNRAPRAYTPTHLAEKILSSRSALEGERKTITALFADIKGSMELIEDLDPEDARHVIDPALQLMMDAVHRYEGYVAQSMGDGIFALFGAPLAHEDHPQRALYAALLMQQEAERYGDRLQRDRGIRLPIRVGINTGEVVVRSIRKDDLHADYVPVGHSTSLAARMETLAKPGTVVVSEHTHKLTEGYFQFKALGPAKVKGVSEPVQVYEAVGVGPLRTRLEVAARRGLVRFVGRGQELEQMRRAWESAGTGHGQIVAVMGEAGVGKSRLVHEFKVPLESQGLVLDAFSVSHGKAHAYLPLIDLLKTYFRIDLQDDERSRREKVTGKALTLDRTLEDTLPYLFALLGIAEPTSSLPQMDPQIRRQRTLEAIKRLLLRESLDQPLLLIFEDLHWIDGETQAFLEVLTDSVATAKVLLLVNYRPEYQHGWANKTYYTRLRLDPLGKEEAGELLTALLGNGTRAALEPVKQLILEKTEGNPFFIEELVQTLAEEQVLTGERGSYRLERSPTTLHIPTTVQGILAARMDRLPGDEKEFLQTLSVIGKEFPFGLVRRVAGLSDEELHRLLSHLQAGEFVYEQPAFPEPEYTFKHALTLEVAYQSVLVDRRKLLHEGTAQAIEELHQRDLDAHYNELAHHYCRTDSTRKAVQYLHLAGRQALERSAFAEALRQLNAGLERLVTQPEARERDQQELLLQVAIGRTLQATRGYGAEEVESAYLRARELCLQMETAPQLWPVTAGLWSFYLLRAKLDNAQELAEQLLGLKECQKESGLRSQAETLLGTTLYYRGELSEAREHLEPAIALYDPQYHRSHAILLGHEAGVSQLSTLALALWALGYPDQASRRGREAQTLARDLAYPVSLAFALGNAAALHRYRREVKAAQQQAEALIALSHEHGLQDWLALGTLMRDWAVTMQGEREQGIQEMCQLLHAVRPLGAELLALWLLGTLAEAYARTEQPQEGLAHIAETLDIVDKTQARVIESRLWHTKGELLLAITEPNHAEAESCFREAIDVARRRHEKSYELRAATSLSRLWQGQGKTDDARRLLAPIYDWFTEGFDTQDLKDAKELLDELAC